MEILQNSGYSGYGVSPQNLTANLTVPLLTRHNGSLPSVYNNGTTEFTPPDQPFDVYLTTFLASMAAITSFCTTVGNIMVVISFIMEKQIRLPANYLIASLAVTDIIIGSCSMPLYTMYLLLSYWPLGVLICNLWLSLDYTVCLVSQYTVFLITLDRFCAVKAPARYRNWRTKKTMRVMIGFTWALPTAIFFTTIMGWPYFVKNRKQVNPHQCAAEFQSDKIFSATLVICYYWVTLFVMIGLYVGIYQVALELHKKSQRARKRMTLASAMKKEKEADANEKENLLSSQDLTKGTTTSNESNKVMSNTATTVLSSIQPVSTGKRSENYLTPPALGLTKVDRNSNSDLSLDNGSNRDMNQPPQSLDIDQNSESPSSLCVQPNKGSDESPIWKPRNSLPNASIHWDALTGTTIHKVEKEDSQIDSREGSSRDVSGTSASPSPHLKNKRQSKRRKKSERSSDGKSRDDYNDSSSETSDSENKPKALNQLSTMVAFLAAPKARLGKVKKPSIQRKMKHENRARKALRTITFILGAFVVCWTPYHVLILVFSFCKTCNFNTGPLAYIYQFSYWLCYINSPINPFCYALSNPQFKKSFIKILKFEYCRRWWRKVRAH